MISVKCHSTEVERASNYWDIFFCKKMSQNLSQKCGFPGAPIQVIKRRRQLFVDNNKDNVDVDVNTDADDNPNITDDNVDVEDNNNGDSCDDINRTNMFMGFEVSSHLSSSTNVTKY